MFPLNDRLPLLLPMLIVLDHRFLSRIDSLVDGPHLIVQLPRLLFEFLIIEHPDLHTPLLL